MKIPIILIFSYFFLLGCGSSQIHPSFIDLMKINVKSTMLGSYGFTQNIPLENSQDSFRLDFTILKRNKVNLLVDFEFDFYNPNITSLHLSLDLLEQIDFETLAQNPEIGLWADEHQDPSLIVKTFETVVPAIGLLADQLLGIVDNNVTLQDTSSNGVPGISTINSIRLNALITVKGRFVADEDVFSRKIIDKIVGRSKDVIKPSDFEILKRSLANSRHTMVVETNSTFDQEKQVFTKVARRIVQNSEMKDMKPSFSEMKIELTSID